MIFMVWSDEAAIISYLLATRISLNKTLYSKYYQEFSLKKKLVIDELLAYFLYMNVNEDHWSVNSEIFLVRQLYIYKTFDLLKLTVNAV